MSEQFKSDTHARLSVVESKIDDHDDRLKDLEDYRSDADKKNTKLETLMEMTIETNKEQTKTLNNINENLTNMNERVGKLEHDISQKYTDWGKIIKTRVVPTIIAGVVLTGLYILFGWHK